MKIGICDDDRTDILITQKELQNIAPKLCTAPEIYEFSDGSTMTEDILKTGIDVVLLDIDMPDVNGLSVANALMQQSHFLTIIFLTNRAELVFQSLKYRPLRFVRKSHIREELEEAILTAEKKIASEMHVFSFTKNNVACTYPVREIIYVESKGHYMEIHIGNEIKRERGKLTEYEEKLKDYGFLRIHVCYLFNLRDIAMINSQGVFLDNGEKLPISRQNREIIQKEYIRGLEKFVHGCRI